MSDVLIERGTDATFSYVQGDRTLAVHICTTCGSATHWLPLHRQDGRASRMAINGRMCPPSGIETLTIRRFDGADSWTYLD